MTIHPLDVLRCHGCDAVSHYVRPLCPRCGSEDIDTIRSAGRGIIHATSQVHDREGSHNVSLVDLDEGARVMTEVVLEDDSHVAIGQHVLITQSEGLKTTARITGSES